MWENTVFIIVCSGGYNLILKIIGFLRRNLPIQNTETKTLAYKSMVISNLEYCASVWVF
jgi:hypothetical protein